VSSGDRDGIADLERSIEIAERLSAPEVIRGHINLASTTQQLGDIRRGAELHERGLELARRFGQARGIRFLTSEVALDLYFAGRWDDALRTADDYDALVGEGTSHYMEVVVGGVRAAIAVARDDADRGADEMERCLEEAREIGEPQALYPSLGSAVAVLADAGRLERARALVDELLSGKGSASLWRLPWWAIPGIVVIERLGREDEFVRAAQRFAGTTPWVDAALLYARGGFSEAADLLYTIGDLPTEAQARLRAAEALAAAGRRQAADAEVRRATDFFHSVGATRHLRRAERVLAATA
jgi:tetratricopeptide (TPR) repeat protein